jgi:hypothetical protein
MSLTGRGREMGQDLQPKRPGRTGILRVERGAVKVKVEVSEVAGQRMEADLRVISIVRVWWLLGMEGGEMLMCLVQQVGVCCCG